MSGFVLSATLGGTRGWFEVSLRASRDVLTAAERMLADAHELVLSGWCQGTAAKDEAGRGIEPSSAFARRWSAAGALERVWRRDDDSNGVGLEAYERASLALSAAIHDAPQRWNDAVNRTRDEVLEAMIAAVRFLSPAPASPLAVVEDYIEEAHRGDGPELFAD